MIHADSNAGLGNRPLVLVTGATGFLGTRVVECLIRDGYPVRALARHESKVDRLRSLAVEIHIGDVCDCESLKDAFAGVQVVVHAAAGTSGTEDDMRKVTVNGTANVLDLCEQCSVAKLIYISSCSVYGTARMQKGIHVDENGPLEEYPELRGIYSAVKLEADKLVRARMEQGSFDIVCIRPGTIYGEGGENFTPIIGFPLKDRLFIVVNQRGFLLPLVFVDNLVDAIVLAINSEESCGKIYNVVDPEPVSKRVYMDSLIRNLYPHRPVLYVPYKLFYAAVFIQEKLCLLFGRKPFITCYRLTSSQKPIVYDSSLICEELGWRAKMPFVTASQQIIAAETAGRSIV